MGKICDNRMRVSSSRIYLCCGVVERVRAGLGSAVVRSVVLFWPGMHVRSIYQSATLYVRRRSGGEGDRAHASPTLNQW